MPSDMISCILHDADIMRVARRSMTSTFQSLRSFCRTDSHRSISLISSKSNEMVKLSTWISSMTMYPYWLQLIFVDWLSSSVFDLLFSIHKRKSVSFEIRREESSRIRADQ
jgi:hypothetical protein